MSGWNFPHQGALSPGLDVSDQSDQSGPLLHPGEGIASLSPTLDVLSSEHEAILGAIEDNNNGEYRGISQPSPGHGPNRREARSLASQPPSMVYMSTESQDEDVFYPNKVHGNYNPNNVNVNGHNNPNNLNGYYNPKKSTSEQETSFTAVNMQGVNPHINDSVVVDMDHGEPYENDGFMNQVLTSSSQQGPRTDKRRTFHPAPHNNNNNRVALRRPALPPELLRPISEQSNGAGSPDSHRRNTLGDMSPTDHGLMRSRQLDLLEADRKFSLPAHPSSIQQYLQRRRPSRTYTVINYGHVGQEASVTIPTGREPVARVELFDIPDREEAVVENVPDLRRHLARQISRQLSRQASEDHDDCHSIISVASDKGKRKRLLSFHQVSHPDLTSSSLKLHKDETDTPRTPTLPPDQTTYDASRGQHDANLIALQTYGRKFAERKKKRLVQKDGCINVRCANISKRNFQFLRDLFTTMLDLSWRWVWVLFSVTFILSWFIFGVIWFLVAYFPGEFEQPVDTPKKEKCVDGIEDFWTALLFSIETQHTIGYGTRAVTRVCPVAFIVLMVQSLIGVVIQCVMAGVVFAKLAKPKNRAETIMFSKKAAICYEDGQYCLVFRVGDMRRSQLVGCILHAFLVRDQVTKDGQTLTLQREHLEVLSEAEDYDQYLFLAWPTKIIHFITPDSPLWDVSRDSLIAEQFEIIVVLEGIIESSGMTTQIRTSYLPCEIEWGQRFLTLLTEHTSRREVEIDYTNFSRTEIQPNMPAHSARVQSQVAPQAVGVSAAHRRASHRSNVSFCRGP